MNKIRTAVAAMVIAAGAFAAYAFTNVNIQEQPPQPVEYWVTGKTATHFNVSNNPADARDCEGGADPCSIRTTEIPSSSGQLSNAQMSSPNTTILATQPAL